jgi:hypothetical protein
MRKIIRTISTEATVAAISLKVDRIARIVHAMLNAYSAVVGTPVVEPGDYDEAAKTSTESAVQLVLDNPSVTADQLHQSWVQARQNEGWVYGEVKDATAKTHPCLVEWSELSKEHRIKDEFFISIVNSYKNTFGDLEPEWKVETVEVTE